MYCNYSYALSTIIKSAWTEKIYIYIRPLSFKCRWLQRMWLWWAKDVPQVKHAWGRFPAANLKQAERPSVHSLWMQKAKGMMRRALGLTCTISMNSKDFYASCPASRVPELTAWGFHTSVVVVGNSSLIPLDQHFLESLFPKSAAGVVGTTFWSRLSKAKKKALGQRHRWLINYFRLHVSWH